MERVTADRDVEEEAGTFGEPDRRPRAGRGRRPDLLHAGLGPAARRRPPPGAPAARALRHDLGARPAPRVPVTEDEPRTAYGEYGIGKAEIEALLHRETLAGGVPSVVLHPGHICGPGWPVDHSGGQPGRGRLDGGWPSASRSRCPTSASACCTTCTRTTWRRRSSGLSRGRRRSARASTWWPSRR